MPVETSGKKETNNFMKALDLNPVVFWGRLWERVDDGGKGMFQMLYRNFMYFR